MGLAPMRKKHLQCWAGYRLCFEVRRSAILELGEPEAKGDHWVAVAGVEKGRWLSTRNCR